MKSVVILCCLVAAINGDAGDDAREQAMKVESQIRKGAKDRSPLVPVGGPVRFSAVFTNNTVLQRGPEKSSVYGSLNISGGSATPSVTVTVTGQDDGTRYSVEAAVQAVEHGNFATHHWKAFLKPTNSGGNYTIRAVCSNCEDMSPSALFNVTFGDIWYCAGQSNMWLPMRFSFNKNRTFSDLDVGNFSNIRTLQVPNVQVLDDDRADWWVLPEGTTGQGGFSWREGWEVASRDSVEMFSAACWYFAQELTEMAIARGEDPVTYGLIGSYWGGTMIEMWLPNETLSSCSTAEGNTWTPSAMQRWDINAGGLFNGMVVPFVNMTIKGVLWYQGENNVFECSNNASFAPSKCGNSLDHSGYACQTVSLVEKWREIWSMEPGTTNPSFPFGIVSLAGDTSEGHSGAMGSFRLAQSASYGILPNTKLPNTFIAQAYDAPEPWGAASSKCIRPYDHTSPWACGPGKISAPFTPMFMGGIHPRPKHVVGQRLAAAAKALVYGDNEVLWTGPVFVGCQVNSQSRPPFGISRWIDLTFDASLLRGDAVLAWHTTQAFANAISPDAEGYYYTDGINGSPMEVQVDGDKWVSVVVLATSDREHIDPDKLLSGEAHLPPNYNKVSVAFPQNNSANVTGIRYAWGDNPCCPRISSTLIPCPPNSCPIGTVNSTLPAVPFYAQIVDGKCKCAPPMECS